MNIMLEYKIIFISIKTNLVWNLENINKYIKTMLVYTKYLHFLAEKKKKNKQKNPAKHNEKSPQT